ncbi:hypothetical protein ILYODFUR_029852, partial [Ilyodon furcidens]
MRVCEELAASPSALDCNPSLLSRLVFSDVSAYADILLLFVPCSMLPCGDFRRAMECSWISSHLPPNNNFWLPASMAGNLNAPHFPHLCATCPSSNAQVKTSNLLPHCLPSLPHTLRPKLRIPLIPPGVFICIY